MHYFIIIIFSLFLYSCNSTPQKEKTPPNLPTSSYTLPYTINQPTSTRELPEELKEISALSFDTDGTLYAVNDEKGLVFHLQKDTILNYEFRKKGDYEGIEKIDSIVYVVKSSGTVYKISHLGTSKQMREDFNDFLDDDDDVEGLCYDPKTQCLLLICKGKEDSEKRNVYQFNLQENKLKEEPYFSLELKNITQLIHSLATNQEEFKALIKDKGDELTFAPSAIAIHPQTDHIYVTSSRGKMLLVTNRKGELIHLVKLDKKIHPQPEGLAFDSQGNLYISNEGKEGVAKVHFFKIQ